MSDSALPEANTRAARQLSVVWIVPIVAILAGFWMIYDTLSKRGPEITLTIANAEGIEVDKTVIKVLDVNIGKINSIRLSPDNKSVVMTARLNAGTDSLLRKDTQLWVIKPRFDKGRVSGLSTLFSGAFIQLQPGKAQESRREFTVLPNPPVTAPNVPGLRINLTSRGVGALSVGDPVLYEDFPVGRIETVKIDPIQRTFSYSLYIEQAYAKLVTENSRFWTSSGIQLRTGIDGLKFSTGSLESLISGGVSFNVPQGLPPGEPIQDMASFTLYPDQDSINEHTDERHINYVALFNNSVRGLVVGAPIEYRGLRVGTVAAVPYLSQTRAKHLFEQKEIPVLLRLEIGRMESFIGKTLESDWRKEIDLAIRQGLSVRLKSGNLVTGAVFVDMDFDKKFKNHSMAMFDGLFVIPSSYGGLAQIENKVSSLLDKLDSLPFQELLQNANQTTVDANKLLIELTQLTEQIKAMAASPDAQQLPQQLKQTMDSLQQTLDGLSPKSPMYQELNRSIENLNHLLRDIRPVIRTINERPNALLFDRNVKDEAPKGAKP